MAYKGNDLDLRPLRPSVHAWEAPDPTERPATPANGAAAQPVSTGANRIAVDDNVLACCNAAFDVARFHASQDVRLEHLLHALTRVGVAVELLTDLGIRVDMLRRETAVAIAAEMPAGPVEDDRMPHASTAFEDVLRRAADQAAKRHVPAGLHDLLRTMLGGGAGSPSAALLMQAAADPQRLERWRDAPLRTVVNSAIPEEIAGAAQAAMSPGAAEALLGRLDLMEAALRALQAEAAADRHTVSNLLREVQSGLQTLHSERTHAGAGDRSHAVDAMLETKLGDLDKSVGALGKRLAGLDKIAAASNSWPDTWEKLRTSMETVEGRFGTQTLDVANRIADAFADRLGKTEAGLQRLREETERHWSSNGERQIALEASVRAHLQGTEEAGKTHARDLSEIYQALVKLGANQQTLGDNFTAWRIESGGDIGIVNNRLQQLEQTILDLLGHLGNELQALRQEAREGRGRLGGFKRWLYGTGNVFAAGWRDEIPANRQVPGPAPKEDAPDAKVEIVEKKS